MDHQMVLVMLERHAHWVALFLDLLDHFELGGVREFL